MGQVTFAGVTNGRNNPVQVARLFGAGEAIRESIGASIDIGFRGIYDFLVAQTKSMLDEATFQATWAEGRAMPMDQAIEFAIEAKE